MQTACSEKIYKCRAQKVRKAKIQRKKNTCIQDGPQSLISPTNECCIIFILLIAAWFMILKHLMLVFDSKYWKKGSSGVSMGGLPPA